MITAHRLFIAATLAGLFAIIGGAAFADGDLSPLHYLAAFGPPEVALALIVAKADLHHAAKEDNIAEVKRLIDSGADIDAKDNDGWTPLQVAAYWGQTKTVLALINAEADIEMEINDFTPLHLATQEGQTETVLALVKAGANIEAKVSNYTTPLHMAARKGQTKIALVLINAGADVDAKDNDGLTPLHVAAFNGQAETVLALIKAGANIEAKDRCDRTPMHSAVLMDDIKTALALVNTGADIDAKDNDGFTPLHLAAKYGQTETALALVNVGASIGTSTKYGRMPVHIAAQAGKTETMHALIEVARGKKREIAARRVAEREQRKRQAAENPQEYRHRVLEIERAALHFALATPDSEFRHGGEITVFTADYPEPQKIKAFARVFPSTINRIDADYEAARICYVAHGFYCVAESPHGGRIRLFRAIDKESVVRGYLRFAGKPERIRPVYEKAFLAYYGVQPTIDIVKEREIARGKLPEGAGDCPIYNFPGRDGAKPGYVYVMSNPRSYPPINGKELYKIGMTEDTVDKRRKGLSNTSVLYDFETNLALATQNAKDAEEKIHKALDRWRVRKDREFFRISAKELEFQLSRLIGIPVKLH